MKKVSNPFQVLCPINRGLVQKRAATDSGFYNKNLAKRLSIAILVRTIENLLNSKQEMTDRIIYLADIFCT